MNSIEYLYPNFTHAHITIHAAVGDLSLAPPVLPYYSQQSQLPHPQPGLGTSAGDIAEHDLIIILL